MTPENRKGNNIIPELSENIAHHPSVSIIIPVYNDVNGIRDTLLSLFAQNYPEDKFEIIVVDNNSTDDTHKTILKTGLGFEGNIVIEKGKKTGSYAARNKGLQVSKGEIIAFIDSDMTVKPDWLQKGVKHLLLEKADYLGCQIQIRPNQNKPSLCEKYDIALGLPVKDYMELDGYAPTACLFVRRTVIDAVGKFDDRLLSGGDVDFGTRVRNHKFKMYFDPDNVMCHPARTSFKALLKKHKRVTLGQIELRRLFPERFKKNRLQDLLICVRQCLPVTSPKGLKKLSKSKADFFPLFLLFYILRLYRNGIKIINRCVF
jgi:glycosyltransferase involved in cell wall biosynthesis